MDHSNSSPPWWHVAYVFTLKIAKSDGNFIDFIYQMEPYMIPEIAGKSKDFYKQFILVENEGIEIATSLASDLIDNLYGFNFGKVLFKPTLSGGNQTFRTTKEGALSYFVGHNPAYPNDSGFGIKFWREINSDTSAIFIDNTVAMWMGWVTFIDICIPSFLLSIRTKVVLEIG